MPAKASIVLRRQMAPLALFMVMVLPFAFGLLLSGYQTLLQYSVTRRFEYTAATGMVLPAHTLVWKKKNRELWIDNRPFDIKTITYKSDGTVAITGFFDDEENWALHVLHRASGQLRNQTPQHAISLSFVMLLVSPLQYWSFCMPEWHQLQEPCGYVDIHLRAGFALRRLRPPAVLA